MNQQRVYRRGCAKCFGTFQCGECQAKYDPKNIKSKFCPCCETEKPASDFGTRARMVNRQKVIRLSSYCKLCNALGSWIYRKGKIAKRDFMRGMK